MLKNSDMAYYTMLNTNWLMWRERKRNAMGLGQKIAAQQYAEAEQLALMRMEALANETITQQELAAIINN